MSELKTETESAPVAKRLAVWNPTHLALLILVFSIFPIGLFYALNFERLGQSSRKKWAIAGVVLATAIYLAASVPLWMREPAESNADYPLRVWFYLVGIIFAWRFYLAQQPAFVRHVRSGGAKASLWVPIVWSLVWFGLAYGAMIGWDLQRQAVNLREFDRALKLMESGKNNDAAKIFQQYKAHDPREVSAYWNLALIYERTDRPALAVQELRALLKIDPEYQEAKTLLRELEAP